MIHQYVIVYFNGPHTLVYSDGILFKWSHKIQKAKFFQTYEDAEIKAACLGKGIAMTYSSAVTYFSK